MDIFLDRITQQAVNYAIRSGVTLTATYALRQTTRLMSAVESSSEKDELQVLQEKLQSKIRIISPAIDMIELISARGNSTLESAVELTGRLRAEIQTIANRLENTVNDENLGKKGGPKAISAAELHHQVRGVIADLKRLLSQIEDAVPFLNLALTTSGAKLSTDLPPSISPSRLLQASTFLTAADSMYIQSGTVSTHVGPTFILSLYMLFAGHIRPQYEEEVRASTWKEVIHKARVKLMRVPLNSLGRLSQSFVDGRRDESERNENLHEVARGDEYAYQIHVIEDFDDDRMHEFEENERKPVSFEGVKRSGIKEAIPIHEIAKIFYADTGKILNIGGEDDVHRPVLLLKRDKTASAPRRVSSRLSLHSLYGSGEEVTSPENQVQSALDAQLVGSSETHEGSEVSHRHSELAHQLDWPLPADLDPDWLAFEVYSEAEDSEDEDDIEAEIRSPLSATSTEQKSAPLPQTSTAELDSSSPAHKSQLSRSMTLRPKSLESSTAAKDPILQIKTSLSLLEILLRLTSLQQFKQSTHLAIEDEFLNFFLSESATTGAATGDEHERRALREEARRRVGFDPYDESPIKQRGEEYQYRGVTSQAGWDDGEEIAQSIENVTPSPQGIRKASALGRGPRSRLSGSEFPPMRLRNSPRSSRQGTPEQGFVNASPSNSSANMNSRKSSRLSRSLVDNNDEV